MSQIVIQDIIVPGKEAPCESWRVYFKKLSQRFGKTNARMLWLKTWQVHGSSSCTTNAAFNKWLRQHQIDVSSAATRALADVGQIGSNILGVGKSLTGIMSTGLPIGLVLVAVLIAVLLLNNRSKLVALHPAGRVKKLLT